MPRSVSHGGAKRTASRIAALRQRDGDACQICHGKRGPIDWSLPAGKGAGPSVDHIVPIAAGGLDVLANMQLAHAVPCNNQKGSVWKGVNYGKLQPGSRNGSPYGIGKHYRRKDMRTFELDPTTDGTDWDTPVLPCWP